MKIRQAVPVFVLGYCTLFFLIACTTLDSATAVSSPTSIPPSPSPDTSVQTSDAFYSEAPAWAKQVAQSLLPPVSERLPANPMLLQPEGKVGVYGGVLEMPVTELGNRLFIIGYEPLLRWDPQWLRVIPNVAQSVESSQDATTYTFHLRPGMRWSDGQPFTAADILFWYENVFMNATLTPRQPGWLSAAGDPVTVEKVNDLTVTFRFAEPNSLFLLNLAGLLGEPITSSPRHYLEQFHINTNPDADTLAVAAGYANWTEWFLSKSDFINPELPVLHAWVVQTSDNGRITAERNPYYWKVDTDFKQLPYLDRIIFREQTDLSTAALQTNSETAFLFFAEEMGEIPDALDFTAVTLISSFSSNLVINLNLNHPDPTMRQIFQNITFRQGLSHAINRPYLIETFMGGKGEAYQPAPRPESPYYHEQLAHQFTEYDVALANELLDEAGYGRKDEAGYRLAADGRRITIRLQTPNNTYEPRLQAIQADWQAVGIDAPIIVYDDFNDYNSELFANEYDTFFSEGVGGLNVLLQPLYYFPLHPYASWYASGWGQWFVDANNPAAVEPPPAVQQQMALYRALKATTDSDEQVALMSQILDIATAEFYVIGTVLDPNSNLYISQNLRNVPSVMPFSVIDYPAPAPSNPAQYFIAAPN